MLVPGKRRATGDHSGAGLQTDAPSPRAQVRGRRARRGQELLLPRTGGQAQPAGAEPRLVHAARRRRRRRHLAPPPEARRLLALDPGIDQGRRARRRGGRDRVVRRATIRTAARGSKRPSSGATRWPRRRSTRGCRARRARAAPASGAALDRLRRSTRLPGRRGRCRRAGRVAGDSGSCSARRPASDSRSRRACRGPGRPSRRSTAPRSCWRPTPSVPPVDTSTVTTRPSAGSIMRPVTLPTSTPSALRTVLPRRAKSDLRRSDARLLRHRPLDGQDRDHRDSERCCESSHGHRCPPGRHRRPHPIAMPVPKRLLARKGAKSMPQQKAGVFARIARRGRSGADPVEAGRPADLTR